MERTSGASTGTCSSSRATPASSGSSRDLNRLYRAEPALWERDFDAVRLPLARGERRRRERPRLRALRQATASRMRRLRLQLLGRRPHRLPGRPAARRRAGARSLNTDAEAYGGSGRRQRADRRPRSARWHEPAVVGRADAAAARVVWLVPEARSSACGPAARSRSARPGTARERTSRSSPSTPSGSSSASSTTDGRETRHELPPAHRASTGTATCPGSAPGQRYGYRVHGPYAPEQGHRFNPAKLLIDPYAQGDRGRASTGTRRACLALPARRRGGRSRPTARTTRPRSRSASSIDPALRLGGRPAARDAVERDGDLRGARQGLHEAAPGRARGPARHLRRARLGRGDRLPARPRRDRGRAAAGPPHHRRAVPARARADELLGLLVDRLLRPARRVRGDRSPRRAGDASSRGWSRRCTAPGSR